MKVLLCCEDIHALLAFKQLLNAAKSVDIDCAVSVNEAQRMMLGEHPEPLVVWVGKAQAYEQRASTFYARLKPEIGKMPMVVGKGAA